MSHTPARTGSFDTVRLVAALMVFHSHSFSISGSSDPWLPGNTVGGTAVMIFFVISGYWVSNSALQRSLAAFLTARALRIVPGLLVCLAITIAACAFVSALPPDSYFRHPDTWGFLRNALPFWLPMAHFLPGVFQDGAYHNVNGSLWTLRYEVFCYLVAAGAAMFGPKGLRLAAAGFAVFALSTLFRPHPGGIQLFDQLEHHWVALLGTAFFFGAVLNGVGDRTLAALTGLAAFWLAVGLNDARLAQLLSIFVYGGAALWVGRNLNLDRMVTRGRDLSYGVYIYAYPCEQLATRMFPATSTASFLAYYLTALAATLALAWVSWVAVEKPVLRLKQPVGDLLDGVVRRLTPRRAARAGAAAKSKQDVVAP